VDKDIVYGVAAVGILYLLWKAKETIEETAQSVADSIAAPVASVLIKFLLPEPVNVTGAAILPDGRAVAFSSLNVKKVANQEVYYFDYGGKRYQLGPRSAKGNYPTRLMT